MKIQRKQISTRDESDGRVYSEVRRAGEVVSLRWVGVAEAGECKQAEVSYRSVGDSSQSERQREEKAQEPRRDG